MSSQEGYRVEDNTTGGLAGVQSPAGLSMLDALEAAARDDVVVGEGSGNNPLSTTVDADVAHPSSSQPSTLLLTRTREELAQLGRVERISELLSSWEVVSGIFGAKLKEMS